MSEGYEKITRNKRAYLAHLKAMDDEVRLLQIARNVVVWKFKKNCPHPKKSLESKTNDYQDEYGRWTNYEDYDYWCNRCDTKIYNLKKKLNNVAELQRLLKEHNDQNR